MVRLSKKLRLLKSKNSIVLLIFYALVLSGCSSFLYYPTNINYIEPKKMGLKYEDLFIPQTDGSKLHAWYFAATTKKSKGTLVFLHGNAQNISSHFLHLSWLPALGYNYIIFDYPGYGQSAGKPSPKSTLEAAKAVIRWTHKNKDSKPLIIYGQSLGGIVALRATEDLKSEIPVKLLIVDSSFYSYEEVARSVMSNGWLTWIFQPLAYLVMSDRYAPGDLSELSPIPILYVHGAQDTVVRSWFSEKMYARSKEPKHLWILPEAKHAETYWTEKGRYRQQLVEFLDSTQ